jgi:hypothetical protein
MSSFQGQILPIPLTAAGAIIIFVIVVFHFIYYSKKIPLLCGYGIGVYDNQ